VPALERASPGPEHDDGAPGRVVEPPAVEVPHDVDGSTVDEDFLVPPKVLAQAARLHSALPVDVHPEHLLIGAGRAGRAADADLMLSSALREPDPRGVHHVGGRVAVAVPGCGRKM
jgi:hypothetical protein